jgi:hypothetical protein
LPDGIFSNRKSQFGKILEGLGIEKVGTFYGRLEYITAIWYISWQFGIIFPFWYVVQRKIWQPWKKSTLL